MSLPEAGYQLERVQRNPGVLHAFAKKTSQTAQNDIELAAHRLRESICHAASLRDFPWMRCGTCRLRLGYLSRFGRDDSPSALIMMLFLAYTAGNLSAKVETGV